MKSVLTSMVFIILILFSCNQKKKNNTDYSKETYVSTKITGNDISKLKYIEFSLDSKAEKIVENWEGYSELESIVIKIKKGDLSYFKENGEAIATFVKALKEKVPDTINTASVQARITALETKLYKLESLYNLSNYTKDDLKATITEFLESLSNLNLQINKKLEKDSQHIEKP